MDDYQQHTLTKKDSPKQIYQLKIALKLTKPLIWRRLLILNQCTFFDLHQAIQECFNWDNSHLHEFFFCIDRNPYTRIFIRGIYPDVPYPPDFEYDDGILEIKIRLCDVFSPQQQFITYRYDFGDNWELSIKLEKVFSNASNFKLFICVDGKRAAPPEDCGGVYGYERLLTVLKNPKHREYKEMKEWISEDFDLEQINCPIKKMTPQEISDKYGPEL
jgi:hypothetical protein